MYVALRAQGWRASTRFDPLLGQRTLPPRRRPWEGSRPLLKKCSLVEPGTTCICQSFDLTYFRSFTSKLRSMWTARSCEESANVVQCSRTSTTQGCAQQHVSFVYVFDTVCSHLRCMDSGHDSSHFGMMKFITPDNLHGVN